MNDKFVWFVQLVWFVVKFPRKDAKVQRRTAITNNPFPADYTGAINGIAFGAGKFAAVGSNGRIAYSD